MPDEQRFESPVWFVCPKCGEHVHTSVEVPEPDWSTMESSYDAEGEGNFDLICPHCEAVFDAAVSNYGGSVEVTIDEFPDTKVHAESPFFSPDLEYNTEPPDDPVGIFHDAFDQITKVLDEHGSYEDAYALINRMAFVQYISAFEAYLAETLVLNVAENKEAIEKLVASDKHLKEIRLGLAEVMTEPDIVRQRVRSYLRNIVYHQIGRVHALYAAALDIDISVKGETGSILSRAIEARHDCVHRNGFTRDGERNTMFSPPYVKKVADALQTVVMGIERQLNADLPF